MKVWFGVIGFVIGSMLGVVAGFAVDGRAPDRDGAQAQADPVPAACLDAIAAARDRLLLNPDVTETLRDYRSLGEEIRAEVSDLQVPDLRRTLARFNDLNDRSSELLDRSVDSRFSAPAAECERIASEG